jgi:hypothetical protein
MATKPVVHGIEKQLAGKVRIVQLDVASETGRKVAAKVGIDLVPTFIGYDAQGIERWRIGRAPARMELWRRIVSL